MNNIVLEEYRVDERPSYDIDLLKYALTKVDKNTIGENIYINTYYRTRLQSTGAEGVVISYELNNNGVLKKWCIEYDIFKEYKMNYKEKIRLLKIKKLFKK